MHCDDRRNGEKPSWCEKIEQAMKKQVKESGFIPSLQSGISARKYRTSKDDFDLIRLSKGYI